MRIRKNLRVLVEGNPANQTPFLICKLNRSPWDDDSYFSQLVEEDWNNSLPLNGSLTHSNLVSESNHSGDSMELSFEFIEKQERLPASVVVAKLGEKEVDDVIEAKTTSLCNEQRKPVGDHVVKGLLSPSLGINKVVAQPPQAPPFVAGAPPKKKRGRPKKPPQTAAGVNSGGGDNGGGNNSYSFYYYSGFGPSWSKKRSVGSNKSNKNNDIKRIKKKKNGFSVVNCEKNGGFTYNNVGRTTSSSSTSQIMSENDDRIEEDGDNKSKNGVVVTVFDEQLDYIDDDFDDDDDNGDDGVRGRPRKPIKARSLKSLM